MNKIIDLRSDTVTQPTPAMRKAMYECEVGDDVYRDDPTMNRLEETAAEVLGKEAALFVSSGTMGNQLGILSQTQRGEEIIVSHESHIFEHECGAPALLSGVNQNQISFENGIFDAARIEKAIRPDDIHMPRTALICVENALSNGRVVPLSVMREVYALGQRRGIPVHLDGARLFNAALALNADVKELTAQCDTLSCCLSKGLCAPVGAIFAGRAETVERARRFRKLLGGGMRQAGFLAAAGLIAITEMPKRLCEDHENARHMAERLSQIPGVYVDLQSVQINMVFFHVSANRSVMDGMQSFMLSRGVKINPHEFGVFRFVLNAGVSRADADYVVDLLAEAMNR